MARRPPAARPRCTRISRLMYAASAALRDSSTSARMASSSRPSCSTSSVLRWVYSATSAMAMSDPLLDVGLGVGLDVERAVTDGGGDAGLHLLVGLSVLVAVAQVADRARDQGDRAGVADAHAAAVGHPDACLLAGLEDGGGAVDLDLLAGVAEGQRPALAALSPELEGEALDVQPVLEPGVGEVL